MFLEMFLDTQLTLPRRVSPDVIPDTHFVNLRRI